MGISIIEVDRYRVHPYNGRKYWKVIQECILNNTKSGDLILDPFMGSGVTIIESLILKRKAIGIDIVPLSLFIVNSTLDDLDLIELNKYLDVVNIIEEDIFNLYKSKHVCAKCNVNYIVYSYVKDKQTSFYCSNCKNIVKLPNNPDFLVSNPIITKWIPKDKLPENIKTNVDYISDLFSKRNLVALSIILDKIDEIKDKKYSAFFKFCFSSNLSKSTKLNTLKENGRWGRKESNSFSISEEYIDFNVWFGFLNAVQAGFSLKKEMSKFNINVNDKKLYIANSENIDLMDNSVDCIITDPPYFSDISYKAISDIQLSWLKLDYTNLKSQSLDEFKDKEAFKNHLINVFKECYRVLKYNSSFIIVLANVDEKFVQTITDCCNICNFILFNKTVLKTHEKLDSVIITYKKS